MVTPADAEQRVLCAVVVEHELARPRRSSRRAVRCALPVELTRYDEPVQQDLDVDLVVAAVDPRGVVDRVGVEPASRPGELDPAPLGQPQVAALPDDLAPAARRRRPGWRRSPCPPTSACVSPLALTYVPMPPFHSRSAGARRIARINSGGFNRVTSSSIPNAARISAPTGTDFAVRGHTPPPALIAARS